METLQRHHNAATRVAAALESAVAHATHLARARRDVPCAAVWAAAFHVRGARRPRPPPPPPPPRREVARNLLLLAGEIDEIERFLGARTQEPVALYAGTLRAIREGIDVAHITRPWDEIRPFIAAEHALEYLRERAASLMGAHDVVPPPDALDRLRAQLAEIVSESHSTVDLPLPLRTFVLQVAESLNRALRDYDLVGEAAIRREVERLLWEWARVERRRRKAARKWPTLAKAVTTLATAAALIASLDKLLEAGSRLPHQIRELKALGHRELTAAERPDAARTASTYPAPPNAALPQAAHPQLPPTSNRTSPRHA